MDYFLQTLTKEKLFTQEYLYRKDANSKPVVIGIPREDAAHEPRLPFTPEGVQTLLHAGYEVIVEAGAGAGISCPDMAFSEAGACVTESKATVFSADAVCKIAPPTARESEMMKDNAIIFSFLQLHHFPTESFKTMQHKKTTAFAYDCLKDERHNPIVADAIGEIEGKVAVGLLAELLSNRHGGRGMLLGGVAGVMPAKMIVVGAGNACIAAVKAALALGCTVEVFDTGAASLRAVLQHAGGAAVATSVLRPAALAKALPAADAVVVCQTGDSQPPLISEDMVKTMKKGAVIVDMTAAGCFATPACTTLAEPRYTQHGVVHYRAPNLSAQVARTASMALSDALANEMAAAEHAGGILNCMKCNAGFCAYLYNGIVVNPQVGAHFNVTSNDINLLLL